MTKPETTKARRILADRISSSEVVRDGKTYGLSVTWSDGSGQKIFWALDAVEYHATERRGGPRKGAGRKPSRNPSDASVTVRCTHAEKDIWRHRAKAEGMRLAEWVRGKINE